jgi:hypothetical protein
LHPAKGNSGGVFGSCESLAFGSWRASISNRQVHQSKAHARGGRRIGGGAIAQAGLLINPLPPSSRSSADLDPSSNSRASFAFDILLCLRARVGQISGVKYSKRFVKCNCRFCLSSHAAYRTMYHYVLTVNYTSRGPELLVLILWIETDLDHPSPFTVLSWECFPPRNAFCLSSLSHMHLTLHVM